MAFEKKLPVTYDLYITDAGIDAVKHFLLQDTESRNTYHVAFVLGIMVQFLEDDYIEFNISKIETEEIVKHPFLLQVMVTLKENIKENLTEIINNLKKDTNVMHFPTSFRSRGNIKVISCEVKYLHMKAGYFKAGDNNCKNIGFYFNILAELIGR